MFILTILNFLIQNSYTSYTLYIYVHSFLQHFVLISVGDPDPFFTGSRLLGAVSKFLLPAPAPSKRPGFWLLAHGSRILGAIFRGFTGSVFL